MLSHSSREVVSASSTGRFEESLPLPPIAHADLEESRLIIAEQRHEVELLQGELSYARKLSLRLLERLQTRCATVSPTGEILNCSQAFAGLLKMTLPELFGCSLLDYLQGADRGSFLTNSRDCLRGHKDATFEVRLVRPQFPALKLRLSMSRLPASSASEHLVPAELLLLVTDASMQVQENCERGGPIPKVEAREPAPLEVGSAPPVPDVSQPSPASSRSPNAETVGWFAGGLAHDFNNLLTVITCNISMAMMEVPGESPIVPLLRDAAQAVGKATELTGQLLEYSRRQPAVPEPARIDQLVENLLPVLRDLVGDCISFRTFHESDGGIINIDPRQFEQVVSSLVLNARDAMTSNGRISIETGSVVVEETYRSCRPPLSTGSYVTLRVIDQGSGMTQDALERLFEPFFSAQSAAQNVGIGLATCYTAVRQAGGGIEVHSDLGAGTTVTVYWPCVTKATRSPPSGCYRVRLDGGPATILLVEDEPSLRSLGIRILKRLGYRVLDAANGIEALEVASNHLDRIDLLFTDIVMPGMNGRQLAEQLRARRPELRVLFTSGYTDRIFDASFDDASPDPAATAKPANYLSKPYKPDALANRIKEILRSRHE